ncbi:ArnT family glycosyltransferase [Roseateles koreensis]|uniref:Glycosyltransferase family 39 protein n=1 Tax=Roseateles koreensis TaxID=2987526 RepID=A0ABT5KZ42_9BURK|nr:glycosyltransferase family 39 protein [Roseateles koreensis]MDC8786997.1 glycosyltransferase family 39 protein [Roseateles koreensis]
MSSPKPAAAHLPQSEGRQPSGATTPSSLPSPSPLPLMQRLLHHPWWSLALAALALLVTLPYRPVALPDEGRYVGVAAMMWHSGDWLTPHINGLPYFHKPPLFYWLAGLSFGLSGENAIGARVVPWLAALAAMASLTQLIRRHLGDKPGELGPSAAAWALIFMVAQPLWHLGSQFANLDMLVASCISIAICSLASHAMKPSTRLRSLGFAAMALGVLAKGLIGVVLPLLVLGVWLFWAQGWRSVLQLLWWRGWVLFALVGLPWFLLMEQHNPDFFHYFFVVHHFNRYASDGFNNVMPAWFYPGVLIIMTLPWAPVWLWLMPQRRTRRNALGQLALVWLLAITLFFTLPSSKLLGYILPVGPALALLIAPQLAAWQLNARGWLQRLPGLLTLGGVVLTIGMLIGIRMVDTKSNVSLVEGIQVQWQPGDALVFENQFAFDVPLLLRRTEPVPIVMNNPFEPQKYDSWRREIVEAAEFNHAKAEQILLSPQAWAQRRCAAPRTWIVVDNSAEEVLIPERQGLPVAASSPRLNAFLWVARDQCNGQP